MANIHTSATVIKFLDASEEADIITDAYTRDMYALHAIQSDADGSNTFDIEYSVDGITFVKLGSTINSATITHLTAGQVYPWVRIHRQSGTDPLTVTLLSADRLRR